MYQFITYDVRDGVAHVTLNRPEKFNALSDVMADELLHAWASVEADPSVHAAILKAEGRHFCAGADMTAGAADLSGALPGLKLHQTYLGNGVDRFKPVIGVVQGYALGAGFLLAVRGCDIVVACDDAGFGYPEGPAGIALAPPEPNPFMPFKMSLEFMLLAWKGGEIIGAERAYQLGFVNRVAPRDRAVATAIDYAKLLKKVPPLYIRSVKAGHYRAALSRTAAAERDYAEFVAPQVTARS